MANLERIKGKNWEAEQKKKGVGRKLWNLVNEPRWKFYVKPGHAYTVRTGVPGVWEEIARVIQEQTAKIEAKGASKGLLGREKLSKQATITAKEPPKVTERKVPDTTIRRQTFRSARK